MSQSSGDRLPVQRPDTPEPQRQLRAGPLPPCKVILLQNPSLDLMFIIRTVMELTRLCRAEATHKMWEAYYSGRSQLLTTHRERAELFVEQFAERGLKTTAEPS